MNLELLRAIVAHPQDLVLCTVLRVRGSAPRHAGSKMLVGREGRLLGSVGGGRGEALALAESAARLGGAQPAVLEIDMQGMDAEGPAMVCGGTSRLFVEPLGDRTSYRSALGLLEQGVAALLVKRLDTGQTALLDAAGAWVESALSGTDAQHASQALEHGLPVLDEEGQLLYDPLLPKEKLLILGAGHVGTALAALVPSLGFEVTIGDDRPSFLEPRRFPGGVYTLGGSYADIVAAFPFDASTSVVIVTRGHLSDLECVRLILPKAYRYAGFMGSLRKTRLVLDQVATEGFDPAKVAALRAPIGLEIGAETPEELAVALAAELIAARRKSPAYAATHAARQARRQTP